MNGLSRGMKLNGTRVKRIITRQGYVQSTIDRQLSPDIQAPPVHLSLLSLLERLGSKVKCPRRQQSLGVHSVTVQSTIQVRQKGRI